MPVILRKNLTEASLLVFKTSDDMYYKYLAEICQLFPLSQRKTCLERLFIDEKFKVFRQNLFI